MPFRIAPFPRQEGEQYLQLFYGALAHHGITAPENFVFSPLWMWKHRRSTDAIHFHWADSLWNGRREDPKRAIAKLFVILAIAKASGVRVFWTVHNLNPHEGKRDRLSRIAAHSLARLADLIICHDQGAADSVKGQYHVSAERIVVMPHGNYDGHYPPPRMGSEVRYELGLDPSRPVISCLGWLRDYKGLDVVIDAVDRMNGEVQLLIAGQPHRQFDLASLKKQVDCSPHVHLVASHLSAQQFSDYLAASDLAVLAYRKITGSGALLAAWTAGRAVVTSNLPYFQEMVTSGSGWTFVEGDPNSLASTIRAALQVSDAEREKAALDRAAEFEWSACIRPFLKAIAPWRDSI